jgi:hypothetical protein
MRRVGRFHFRTAVLAWIVILAIMASSMTASAAPDAHPVTTNPASSDASAHFIQAQTLTINGSSAPSITILSTEIVTIVSPLAGIYFFYDTACSVLMQTWVARSSIQQRGCGWILEVPSRSPRPRMRQT